MKNILLLQTLSPETLVLTYIAVKINCMKRNFRLGKNIAVISYRGDGFQYSYV